MEEKEKVCRTEKSYIFIALVLSGPIFYYFYQKFNANLRFYVYQQFDTVMKKLYFL